MEEDDHDDLLQCTDDESLSENEECLPIEKPEENYRHTLIYLSHTTFEFITTKIFLILSSTFIIILLPLYLESINVKGNAYSLIFSTTLFCTLIFLIILLIATNFCPKFGNVHICKMPAMGFYKLLRLSIFYVSGGFMVIMALDRKRVLCHLQDPIKGIVLVCSLLYYFFFCKKLMGLQRIFSATTIIVGLFIAVDYGLCDEFRCRGYEREKISDDTGIWSWQEHSIWTTVYIIGLGIFACFFTLLERHLLTNDAETQITNIASPLVCTVSRSISHSSPANSTSNLLRNQEEIRKNQSDLHLALWLHVFGLIFVIAMFWSELIPNVGKSNGFAEFWNFTTNGILCHFKHPNNCGNVVTFSWIFFFCYISFVITFIRFLTLSQSAVYTVATMTASLPLVGIWWSLFQNTPVENGLLIWAPAVTGELICSLLGFPIILIGLCLLCKSHFKDYQWSKTAALHRA